MDIKNEIINNLKRHVSFLADEVGPRSCAQTDSLRKAAYYISSELNRYGYTASQQRYEADGTSYANIYAEKKGIKSPDTVIVIGAHYDTVADTPGADDNASGVAGMLELARLWADKKTGKTMHFAAFPLEEPPFFRSRFMGSHVYAESLHRSGINVAGMICLESVGFFADHKDSQFYPLPFLRYNYPDRGNFISFVSNFKSKYFLDRAKKGFKEGTDLPVESLCTFSVVPGVDFSDHRSFWKFGYNAFMVTDTAFYRNPFYHGPGDVPGTLDFERMSKVINGLSSAIKELVHI